MRSVHLHTNVCNAPTDLNEASPQSKEKEKLVFTILNLPILYTNHKVTRCDPEVTYSSPKVTCSGPQVTHSDSIHTSPHLHQLHQGQI